MHNIAIERCFRHIAIGRRNWLHTGSHRAAQNIAFMFGLYESCKLNNVDFGHYIEDNTYPDCERAGYQRVLYPLQLRSPSFRGRGCCITLNNRLNIF